jgi:2-polyprenyl-3-methyl-5-hydroxy-6-metoxy-1,4-benzoquinol methylase
LEFKKMNEQQLKEKIIDYWNRQPCNINHSLSEVGTEKFFNENSEKRYFVEPHLKDLAQFHLYQGKRVLEIGCGMGADAAEFAKHGAEYVGIDLSIESIALAQKRFEVLGLEGEFHHASGDDDLSHLGKFDLVYSCGVLHHYPDIDKIIENIHTLLVDSGELKFLVYARNSWKYAMIQKGLDQYEAQAGCPYAKAYTKEEIYDLLEGKFEIGRIRQAHCFMYNVPAYKQGRYELEPWFAAMPEDMRDAVKEYLGWHLLVKARRT